MLSEGRSASDSGSLSLPGIDNREPSISQKLEVLETAQGVHLVLFGIVAWKTGGVSSEGRRYALSPRYTMELSLDFSSRSEQPHYRGMHYGRNHGETLEPYCAVSLKDTCRNRKHDPTGRVFVEGRGKIGREFLKLNIASVIDFLFAYRNECERGSLEAR